MLRKVLSVCVFTFIFVADVFATEGCENPSMRRSFEDSDVVVLATNLSSPMNFDEFNDQYSELADTSSIRDAYTAYRLEFPSGVFRIEYIYKGTVGSDEEILIQSFVRDFIPGNSYVLFLDQLSPRGEQALKQFDLSKCIFLDVGRGQAILDSVIVDTVNFKSLMNQLMYMKLFGKWPSTVPNSP